MVLVRDIPLLKVDEGHICLQQDRHCLQKVSLPIKARVIGTHIGYSGEGTRAYELGVGNCGCQFDWTKETGISKALFPSIWRRMTLEETII